MKKQLFHYCLPKADGRNARTTLHKVKHAPKPFPKRILLSPVLLAKRHPQGDGGRIPSLSATQQAHLFQEEPKRGTPHKPDCSTISSTATWCNVVVRSSTYLLDSVIFTDLYHCCIARRATQP